MSVADFTDFVTSAARQGAPAHQVARDLAVRYPGIGVGESARALRLFLSLSDAGPAPARSSLFSVSAGLAAGALVLEPAMDPVEDAAYEASLLRLAVPSATPVDIGEQVRIDYPTLTFPQTGRVLTHAAPYAVFPGLAPADLAATLVSPRLGAASAADLAQALHAVYPALGALDVGRLLVAPGIFPPSTADQTTAALTAAGFAPADVAAAVATLFPPPPPPPSAPRLLALDGSSGVKIHSIPAYNFAPGQDFTVECWVRAPQQANLHSWDNNIIEKWVDDGNAPGRTGFPFALRIGNQTGGAAGHLFAARYDLNQNPSIQSAGSFLDDRFHHVAFTNAGRAMTLYVDGQVQGRATDTTSAPTGNEWPLFFAFRGGIWEDNFSGRLMEVRIWSVARSQADLAATMRRALTGTEQGLVGYFKLRDGDGGTARDSTPAGNDGTIFGSAAWSTTDGYPLVEQAAIAPVGGPGTPFDDTAAAQALGAPLRRVRISAGNMIDSIQTFHGDALSPLPLHGGGGGNVTNVDLDPGDPLTSIDGIWGTWYGKGPCVLRLTLRTRSGRSYGPFGDLGGAGSPAPFSIAAPAGGEIVALTGRVGAGMVGALGAMVQTVYP